MPRIENNSTFSIEIPLAVGDNKLIAKSKKEARINRWIEMVAGGAHSDITEIILSRAPLQIYLRGARRS